jgi:hypothetical protein
MRTIKRFVLSCWYFWFFVWRPAYAQDREPGESRLRWWWKWHMEIDTAWRVAWGISEEWEQP